MNRRFPVLASALFTGLFASAQTAPAIEWQRSLGSIADDVAYSICQTSDGGYIMAGSIGGNFGNVTGFHGGDFDAWLVKLDAQGNMQWQRALGGTGSDGVTSVIQSSEGGYVVAGGTNSTDGDVAGNHGGWDVWVVKLDQDGNTDWAKTYGGSADDSGHSIQGTSDGGYIISAESRSADGDVTSNHGGPDCWILKLDGAGVMQWQRPLGGSSYDGWFTRVRQTNDDGYILCGSSASNDGDVTGNHGGFDYWVVKLDANGEVQWERSLGSSSDDYADAVQQTIDRGYIVSGEAWANDGDVTGYHGGGDFWVVKLDSIGGIQWQQCYGGSSWESAQSILQVEDGGYIVSGNTRSEDGQLIGYHGGQLDDAWVIRLNASGDILWQKTLGGSGPDWAHSMQQTTEQAGYIMAGSSYSNDGDVSGNHGGQDYWVVKLGPDNVGIAEPEGPRVFSLYPNPTRDVLNVHLGPGAPAAAQIKLLAADGRCLRTWPGGQAAPTDLALPVGLLPAGVYAVQISTAERSWTQRFVKP